MDKIQIDNIKEVLLLLKECEVRIAELYSLCAKKWPGDEAFWNSLKDEEIRHGHYINSMISFFLEKPGDFLLSRPFNSIAIQTVLKGLEYNIAQMQNNKFSYLNMLSIANDLEQSLLESKFWEYLKTENNEYNKMIRDISGETFQHRRKINNKLNEVKSRP